MSISIFYPYSNLKLVFMVVVSLPIQSVVTFCEFRNARMNITKYYTLEVFGNHKQEKLIMLI